MRINNKKYQQNIEKSMNMLSKNKEVIFIGETVEYSGSPVFRSLINIPKSQKIEMPVFENTQMGISIGLALEGFIPISIFPRMDFLICGIDQLVNHLDKVEKMSQGEFKPGVIIRTQIGNTSPIYPGPQHCQDHYAALKLMCKNINVVRLENENEVLPQYKLALKNAKKGKSTLLIEVPTGAFGGKR